MASTELDLPLLPSAEQIKRRQFATIRRGYDPDQVRDYLQQIALQIENLEREVRDARLGVAPGDRSITIPEPAPAAEPERVEDPYDRLAGRVSDVLRVADDQAERIIQDAHDEAARTISEARAEADRVRVDAQARAEEARQEGGEALRVAKIEAERMLTTLSARRETLVEQLAQMQSRLLGVAAELEDAIIDPDQVDGPPAVDDDAADPLATTRIEEEDHLDPRYEDLWISRDTVALDEHELAADEAEGPQPD